MKKANVYHPLLCSKAPWFFKANSKFKEAKFLSYVHFKMETINSIWTMITPDCYKAKIDIKVAHYSVSILPEHQKYLKFLFQGKFYQFTFMMMMMMMMMMIMNCFYGMVDWQKAFSLIFSWDHCQRSSPSRISNTPWTCAEPEHRLCWMNLCSNDNHCTTAPLYQMVYLWVSESLLSC